MKEAKVILALLATIALVALVVWGGWTINKWRIGAMQNQARGQTMEATDGLIVDGQEMDEERRGDEAAVGYARSGYNTTMSEAERTDEATRNFRGTAVPDSVRNAARERRLARERSGHPGAEREEGRGAEDP